MPIATSASANASPVTTPPSEWPGTVPDVTFTDGVAAEYVFDALDPPESVDTILAAGSAALPVGVTLDGPNKKLVRSGTVTGVSGTTPNIILRSVDPSGGGESPASLADWNARKNAPGVVWATRFDTDADVTGPHPEYTFSDTNFWENYLYDSNGNYGGDGLIYRVPSGGIAGGPAMRLDHPGNLGAQPGAWRRMFDAGVNTLALNTDMYLSAMVYMPPERFAVPSIAGGWKTILLAGWGNGGWGLTCQDAELTMTDAYQYGIVRHYTQCGQGLRQVDFPGSGDERYQTAIDRGAGFANKYDRYCLYQQWNTGSCIRYQPSVWMNVKYRIRRTNGGATANIAIWVQFEGSSAWTMIENYTNYPGWANDPFNTLTLTSYTTGRPANQGYLDLYFKSTEIIRSTQDIAPRTVWS